MVMLVKEDSTCGCGTLCHATIIGRKRILLRTPEKRPLKKNCHSSSNGTVQMPPPEMRTSEQIDQLPEDLLIRIISMAHHGDLKNLLLVSKAIRDAAMISKELHFDFKTPLPNSKSRGGNHGASEDGHDMADDYGHRPHDTDDDPEAPMAPRRATRSRATCKDLAAIAVALFADPQDN